MEPDQQLREGAAGTVTTEAEDEFAQLLRTSFRARTPDAETEAGNAVATLVRTAMEDQTVVSEDVFNTVREMIARLDAKLSDQMNEILHNPEFQKLEGTWLGLKHLIENGEPDSTVWIQVMNISKDELIRSFADYTKDTWDRSPIFRKVYETGLGTLGGKPIGCMIGDYQFDHSPADIGLLRNLGKIANAAHAPFFSAAAPNLLGLDSWNELSVPHDIMKIFDEKQYAAWRSLRESEDARYIGLCLPRMAARPVYGEDSVRVEAFNFEEETDGHAGEKYAWTNAAYAMGANICRAHKTHGWTVQIRGVKSGGEVVDLPMHSFETEDGDTDMKCPTETSITDRREAELSKAGLIALVHRQGSDRAAFIGGQSLYKPKKFKTAEATAADNLSSRLPYMFAVSRFAHYLKHMVRDQIGSTREATQLQRELQNWISQYVHASPANASEAEKARRPLAGAKVEVFEDPENPGYYMSKFFLRPHFQLEGMDIGMSLVSKLPQK